MMDDPRYGPALEAAERDLELGGNLLWATCRPRSSPGA
jgi:hypothetical protein